MEEVDLTALLASLKAELHSAKVDLQAMANELIELRANSTETVEFIRFMQQVVSEMSDNPMLKAMGMGGLKLPEGGFKLPGM